MIFPVKVTAKKNGKKVSKTLTSNITVKNYKVRLVDANNATVSGTAIAVVGTPVQFTAKTAPAKAAVTYTSSDETIATVDQTGKVTPVKAGKVTITAATDKATTSVEVEVKTYALQSVKQTKANTLETVILGKTSDIKPADIKITNTANNNVLAVKSVSVDKTDATKVTVETFADMKDAAKYNVELDGTVKDFTATDGVIVDVNVTPVTIAANTKGTEIKGQTLAKNDIVIDEFTTTKPADKTELTLTTNQGYVDGDKLVLPTIGNKGTAEVKYHTYKFNEKGEEVGALTKKVEITAVAETAIETNVFNMTFASKAPNWSKDTASNQIAVNSGKNAYFQFKGSDGKEIVTADYANYYVESSNDTVLLLPKTQLTSSTSAVTAAGIKAGSAYVNVLNKDGKVIKSLPVVVTDSSKLSNVTLGSSSVTISNVQTVNNTATVDVKSVDQYNGKVTADSVIPSLVNGSDAKINFNGSTKEKIQVNVESGCPEKTYTVKVEVKKGDVTVNRYFTVRVVKTVDSVAKCSNLQIELTGLTDGKVDMAIADDATKANVAKTVNAKVAAYDNGAYIGDVSGVSYKVNGTTTGSAIKVVDVDASGNVTKKLEAGKTYTVEATYTYPVDGKNVTRTFSASFAVVDTQASASVKINSKTYKTATDANAILAETCEATYDGTTYKTFADAKATVVSGATYISTANVVITKGELTYKVPVTINTTFTK